MWIFSGYFLLCTVNWISLCRQNKTSSFGILSPIIHYLLWQFTLTFWQINQQWALVISCSPDSDWCSFLPLCPWRWRWRCTLSWRPGCRTSGKAWSCCRRRYQTLNHDYWWLTSYPLTLTKALQTDVFWPDIMRIPLFHKQTDTSPSKPNWRASRSSSTSTVVG